MRIPVFNELVIFRSEDYLMINKPPGISTLEDRASPQNLLAMARQEFPDVQVCHRLDKETSGVLLLALNQDAYRNAAIQFESRKVKKIYNAIVEGRVEWKMMEVSQPIQVSSSGVGIRKEGKEAITYFTTEEIFQKHSLIECLPVTGRMHQIRLHLAHLGHPIVGDESYGGRPFFLSEIKRNYNIGKYEEERPLISRVALHAKFLELEDLDGKMISAIADLPKDLSASLRQLRKHL